MEAVLNFNETMAPRRIVVLDPHHIQFLGGLSMAQDIAGDDCEVVQSSPGLKHLGQDCNKNFVELFNSEGRKTAWRKNKSQQ